MRFKPDEIGSGASAMTGIRMPRTLQITGDSEYGGAAYLIVEWSKYLIQRGWAVDVLTTNELFQKVLGEIGGVRVIDHISIPRGIRLKRQVAALIKTTRFMRRERYDVVQTYTANAGFVGRIAARIAGVSKIFHHQAGWPIYDASSAIAKRIYGLLEFSAALCGSKCICVSHSVRKEGRALLKIPDCRLVTICNGIDPERMIRRSDSAKARLKERYGIPPGHLVLGNTSRLAPQKDNATLIHAVRELVQPPAALDCTLLLAGRGPEEQELARLIQELDLTRNVTLCGHVEDIPNFVAGLDIFINPSLWEGLSISLLEAMAAEMPIITTAIGPNLELIRHRYTGLIVPPKSSTAISGAVRLFDSDRSLAESCAKTARMTVLKAYTIETMLSSTLRLYETVK
jgi:glycosyltransferase involved in cell wall biosynthesis